MLHFLATYWASVAPSLRVFGEARSALARTGLASPAGPTGACPSGPGSKGAATLSSRDSLAMALLQVPGSSSSNSSSTPAGSAAVGSAALAVCLELAGGAGSGAEAATLQAAAAELVQGCMRLGSALHRPSDTHAEDVEEVQEQEGESSGGDAYAASFALHVQSALAPQLAWQVSSASGGGTSLKPWDLARLQQQQPLVRLLLAASRLADWHEQQQQVQAGHAVSSGSAASESGQVKSQAGKAAGLASMDAWLSVPVLSPPGAEAQCLPALRYACKPQNLSQLLPGALASMAALQAESPRLAVAAAGLRDCPAGSSAAAAAALGPYPLPSSVDAEAVGRALFEGYAAAWLSMINATRLDGGEQGSGSGGAAGADPAAGGGPLSGRLCEPFLGEGAGSRLPAPPVWLMSEALLLPAHPTQSSRGSQQRSAPTAGPAPMHPAAGALALACALEAAGSRYMARCGSGGRKLACALQAAFLFNAAELVEMQRSAAAGAGSRGSHRNGHGAMGAHGEEEGEEEEAGAGAWWEPLARWALAALSQRYGLHGQPGSAWSPQPAGWCSAGLAEKLAEQFGNTSFGDPLLGLLLASLLTPGGTPLATQRALWGALVQVGRGKGLSSQLHLIQLAVVL